MGLDAEGGFMVSKEIKSIKRVLFIIRCSMHARENESVSFQVQSLNGQGSAALVLNSFLNHFLSSKGAV